MSMPAGWYGDGSGRQRWWDGQKWTDQFATGGSAPHTPPQIPNNGPHLAATSGRVAPVLGFAGLGLAVVGTVLACIPATFIVGVVVLIAAFVVSLIGLFKKNATKWPSIVGIVLAVVGGAIGTVVSLVIVAATLAGPLGTTTPTVVASPSPSIEEPTPSSVPDPQAQRPSPEEIAAGLQMLAHDGGITGYDDQPDFFLCSAQYFYESELSDEALELTASGQDVTGAERELAIKISTESALACDPQP